MHIWKGVIIGRNTGRELIDPWIFLNTFTEVSRTFCSLLSLAICCVGPTDTAFYRNFQRTKRNSTTTSMTVPRVVPHLRRQPQTMVQQMMQNKVVVKCLIVLWARLPWQLQSNQRMVSRPRHIKKPAHCCLRVHHRPHNPCLWRVLLFKLSSVSIVSCRHPFMRRFSAYLLDWHLSNTSCTIRTPSFILALQRQLNRVVAPQSLWSWHVWVLSWPSFHNRNNQHHQPWKNLFLLLFWCVWSSWLALVFQSLAPSSSMDRNGVSSPATLCLLRLWSSLDVHQQPSTSCRLPKWMPSLKRRCYGCCFGVMASFVYLFALWWCLLHWVLSTSCCKHKPFYPHLL